MRIIYRGGRYWRLLDPNECPPCTANCELREWLSRDCFDNSADQPWRTSLDYQGRNLAKYLSDIPYHH